MVADHQTAGRGRLGRAWVAPPGASLLASVLLRPTLAPERRHLLVAAAALAMAEAVEATTGVVAGLKWPNDLLVGERKLCGVLAEAAADALVVGLGVNVEWTDVPAELATDRHRVQPRGRPAGRAAGACSTRSSRATPIGSATSPPPARDARGTPGHPRPPGPDRAAAPRARRHRTRHRRPGRCWWSTATAPSSRSRSATWSTSPRRSRSTQAAGVDRRGGARRRPRRTSARRAMLRGPGRLRRARRTPRPVARSRRRGRRGARCRRRGRWPAPRGSSTRGTPRRRSATASTGRSASIASMPSCSASSSTSARVTPSRHPALSGGVTSVPASTRKTFEPVASQRSPRVFAKIASPAPCSWAWARARHVLGVRDGLQSRGRAALVARPRHGDDVGGRRPGRERARGDDERRRHRRRAPSRAARVRR